MTAGTVTPVTTPRLGDPPVPETLLDGLNPDQAAAVQAIHGPVLVVAGPGSGKTRVLVNRIAAITATRSAPPERILAVTFTNKAAGEMRERLSALIPDGGSDRMWVSTFHSLCARILRMEHEAAELPRAYTIVDADDAASIIRTVLTKQELPDTLKDAREYGKLISRVKNGGNPPFDPYLAGVYAEYQNTLTRLGCVDFDDLLLITARILRERADVRNRWARRFSYILIDEYQDTNPVQYELVRLLAEEHRNLCCVGDADQAIYGFRSASPAALVSFQQDWPDSRIVYLGENYRCSGNILAAAQAVIEHTPSPLRPQLRTANPAGDPVRLVVCGDDRAEAGLIARECREIRRNNPLESVAVLTRTRAMTRSLEEAMLAAGVPYTIVGALRFYDRAEVKDALSWVRFLVNPNDELALRRLVTSPRRGLGDGALQDLVDYASASGLTLRQAISSAEASVLPARSRAKWAELGKVLDQLEAIGRTTNPATLLQGILDAGVRAHTLATGGDTAEDRVENLDELLTGAAAFLAQPNPTDPEQVPVAQLSPWEQVEAFLIHVALLTSAEEGDTANGPVPILTAHASKGKEFDRVYVCGLEEGLFPHSRSTTASALEEERRLLFVACSRARRHLTLTRAERRMTFREVVSNRPSSFLADLPDTVVVEHEHSTYERPRSAPAPTWGGRTSPKRKQVMLPGPRLELGQAHAGMQVHHGSFGTGTITGVNADDDTLTIAFADGVKILKRAMAPLRPV